MNTIDLHNHVWFSDNMYRGDLQSGVETGGQRAESIVIHEKCLEDAQFRCCAGEAEPRVDQRQLGAEQED